MHWHKKEQEYRNQETPNGQKYSDGVGTYSKTVVGEVVDAKISRLSTFVLRLKSVLDTTLIRTLRGTKTLYIKVRQHTATQDLGQ
jgi:hypothetical protein